MPYPPTGPGVRQLQFFSSISLATPPVPTPHSVIVSEGGSTSSTVGPGTAGQFLQSNGPSLDPSFISPIPISSGGTGQTTSASAFDALAPTTTQGDLIIRGATSNQRLAAGTLGFQLQSAGPGVLPVWAGFTQTGTGAVTRTWQSKAADWVNVLDFGADPTSVTDSTTAIQNAINSLPATGGTVIFPNGNYKISAALTIGNGTTTAISSRQGVVLEGLGNSETTGFFINIAPANTPGVRLTWAGTTGAMIRIVGPLQGWGIKNMFLDCANTANFGLEVVSAMYGDVDNLMISNAAQFGLYTHTVPQNSIGDTNVERNIFKNLFIAVSNTAGAAGIVLTTQVPFVNLTSNTDFNTFINTGILLPLSATQTFGIILKGCDSNIFINTQMFGGGTTSVPVSFDYTSGTAGWPASNAFFSIDPGGGQSTATFANNGTPSGATPNYIHALVLTNGAKYPTLANVVTDGGQALGTQTNDNANVGNVGEFVSSTVLVGAAVALSTGVPANLTSISLTAGDWDVWGNVLFHPAGTTSTTINQAGVSTTSAVLPSAPAGGMVIASTAAQVPAFDYGFAIGVSRISIAATTTVFLVAQSNFTVSTNAVYGTMQARRVR